MTEPSFSEVNAEKLRFQKIVLLVGTTIMAVKFAAWILTGSVSILTDALDSIVNVIAAGIGLYALYLSSIPRDSTHPFGHGKIENISSLIEGSMIIVAGLIIMLEAAERIINPAEIKSLDFGLILIGICAAANFITGYYAVRKGRKDRSPALTAAGKHLCTDTYYSVGIILALLVMMILQNMGNDVLWVDGAIAAVCGIVIIITGAKVVKESLDSSMDKADVQIVNEILSTLKESRHGDWIDIHNLRVIKYGSLLHIQMHIVLPRWMTVEDQCREFSELKDSIYKVYGDSVDLIVMGDPCTDDFCIHCSRECDCRSHEMVSLTEWTVEKICEEEPSNR